MLMLSSTAGKSSPNRRQCLYMKRNKTIEMLKALMQQKRITTQQFRTFKGQVLSGNESGCIKGLQRLGLI